MKYKKGAIMSETTVKVLAGVIGLVALLYVSGVFKIVIELMFGKAACIIYAAAGAGGECTHRLTLDDDNLTLRRNSAIAGINTWHSNDKFASTTDYFRGSWKSSYKNDEPIIYEYLMDEKIADEIKYCKDISGALDLSDWWKSQDYTKGMDDKEAMGWWKGSGMGRPPILCFICSRIKFDKDLQDMFKGREITSLNEWMINTPVLGRTSYYEYSLFKGTEGLASPSYRYSTNEAYAVIFSKIDKVGLRWFFSDYSGRATVKVLTIGQVELSKDKQAEIQGIALMPYAEASRECDFLFS